MKTDTLFYRLFQAYPALALEAAGIVVDDPQGYQFRSEEVKETAFRLDGLLIPPPTTPQAPLVFLEAQALGATGAHESGSVAAPAVCTAEPAGNDFGLSTSFAHLCGDASYARIDSY